MGVVKLKKAELYYHKPFVKTWPRFSNTAACARSSNYQRTHEALGPMASLRT